MNDAALRDEAKTLIRQLAGPTRLYDTTEIRQRRVSRILKIWTKNRIADVWRGSRRISIRAHEIDQLRAAAAGHIIENIDGQELTDLQQRIRGLERGHAGDRLIDQAVQRAGNRRRI